MSADPSIRKIILEIADTIIRQYQPKKVILFGSHAYGEATADSDIDLLIVKDTDKRPIDRLSLIHI